MKYKKSVMAILIFAMLAFGGCAENQIPDMTEEEMRAVGEFVAYTMAKYDAGKSSRLMDLPPVEENPDPIPTRSPQETVGMDPVDDTPVIEAPGVEVKEEISYSPEEVMGLPEGVTLAFTGKEICDSYPGESEAFAISATDGKKLLVLKFAITNTLEQETRVDLLSTQTKYRIAVDEERSKKVLTTMLPSDMAFYVDTLSAGSSTETVLITEVDADSADTIASITLQLKNESKSHTIQLVGGE